MVKPTIYVPILNANNGFLIDRMSVSDRSDFSVDHDRNDDSRKGSVAAEQFIIEIVMTMMFCI